MLRMVRGVSPIVPKVGSGDQTFQPIWWEDLAAALTTVVERDDLAGQALDRQDVDLDAAFAAKELARAETLFQARRWSGAATGLACSPQDRATARRLRAWRACAVPCAAKVADVW